MIFGIGLTKTGTTSLTEALKILGYNSIHIGVGVLNDDLSLKMDIISKYDAVIDTPIIKKYQILDTCFPNSNFILTTRNLDEWIKSNEEWFKMEKQIHNYNYHNLHHSIYGSIDFNRYRFIATYYEHHAEVMRYFQARQQCLLILNINSNNLWEQLCGFLNKPIPDCSYPHSNVSIYGK